MKTLCRAGKRAVGATLAAFPRGGCLREPETSPLGWDGCAHAQEYTWRGTDQSSTNTAGTGGRELSSHWKWQHLLHPWEKQEESGDRWPGLSVTSPCCSWASQALCWSGGSESLQLCCTQSTAHAREKSSSCCLQTTIPNPGVISDSYKNKWNIETNGEWNSFLICPSLLLFLKQDEAGTEMGSTVLKWHLQHPRGPFRATKKTGDVLKACRWFLQGE